MRTFRTARAILLASACAAPISAFAQDAGVPDPAAPTVEAQPAAESEGGDIVVTASRREQSIVETPYNISAYSGETLARANITDVAALSRFSPGISVIDLGAGNRTNRNPVTIRGLNVNGASIGLFSDAAVPTVSQYLGETPIQFTAKYFDVERIELLRGPQGTLYGSGALAGTLRVIPRAPQLGKLEGYAYASVGKPSHSGDWDGQVEAAINYPIGDKVALRVAGGVEALGGFIDSRGLVERDANGVPVPRVAGDPNSGFVVLPKVADNNDSRRYFARAALRFEPSDTFDVTISHEYQRTTSKNPQDINPNFPGLDIDNSVVNYPGALYPNNAGVPGGAFPNGSAYFPAGDELSQYHLIPFPLRRTANVTSLVANLDLGFATLSSSTSYVDVRSNAMGEIIGSWSTTKRPGSRNLASFYGFYPRLIPNQRNRNKDRFLTQELRLVSDSGGSLDYVVGAYYQHQKSLLGVEETVPGAADFFGLPAGTSDVSYTDTREFTFRDIAVFGELTWHVTPEWQVTGGVRQFWQKLTLDATQTYPFCGAACANDGADPTGLVSVPDVTSKVSDRIVKLNTSYNITPDMSVYATYSEGFRRGGANGAPTAGVYASLPQYRTYEPDTVANYEAGFKARLGRATFTIAGFIEDWSNFQFENGTPSGGAQVVINGNKARTKGVEIEVSQYRDTGVSYSFGYTYVDAKIASDFVAYDLPLDALATGAAPVAAVSLRKGDKLPAIPAHTATAQLGYGFEVGDDLRLRPQIDISYRSSSASSFPGLIQYGKFDGFAMVNAQIALEAGDRWTATAFVENVGDVLGATAGAVNTYQAGALGSHRFIMRPRTFGLRMRYNFGN